MIANVAWKPTSTIVGMKIVSASSRYAISSKLPPSPNWSNGLPTMPPMDSPYDIDQPHNT